MKYVIDAVQALENYSSSLSNGDRLFIFWTTDVLTDSLNEHIGKELNDFTDVLYKKDCLVTGFVIMARLCEEAEKEMGNIQILSSIDISPKAWRTFEKSFSNFFTLVNSLNEKAKG